MRSAEMVLLVAAINRRNWHAAVRHGENCLAEGPCDPLVYGYVALAKASLGDHDEALRLAKTLRREGPNDAIHLCLVGEILLICKRLEEAEATLLSAKRNNPNSARCLGLLCNVALRRRTPDVLANRIDALARVHAHPVDIIRLEGLLAMMLGKPDNWVHRQWFRLSLWIVLPQHRYELGVILAVLLFVTLRIPPLAGLVGMVFLILSLSGRWYLSGIMKAIQAKEERVELSPDY